MCLYASALVVNKNQSSMLMSAMLCTDSHKCAVAGGQSMDARHTTHANTTEIQCFSLYKALPGLSYGRLT